MTFHITIFLKTILLSFVTNCKKNIKFIFLSNKIIIIKIKHKQVSSILYIKKKHKIVSTINLLILCVVCYLCSVMFNTM